MLSVAVHKDIAEYQPKIVGKMTMRTLVSITGALSVSVLAGLYIYFVLGLNVSDCTYFIYAVSLPFWCGPSEQTVQTTVTMTPSLRM